MDMEKPLLDRAEVVAVTREWIGTRFHHQGRRKACGADKGGCDCLGLLVGVAQKLQLKAKDGQLLTNFDERDYGHIPDGVYLKQVFDNVLEPIEKVSISSGDILLIQLEELPQHVGIVSDYLQGGLGIIHALALARKVVEHRLDAQWQKRIVSAYRLPQLCI